MKKMIASLFALSLVLTTAGAFSAEAKMSKKEAKAACKADGKKGKDLSECVKGKLAS